MKLLTRNFNWMIASGLALALHLLLAYSFLQSKPVGTGAVTGDGDNGVEVGLGMLGGYQELLKQSKQKPAYEKHKSQLEKIEPLLSQTESLIAIVKEKPPEAVPVEESVVDKASDADNNKASSESMIKGGGQANDETAGGKKSHGNQYFAVIMQRLAQFKDYPTELKKQKKQGIVTLAFSIGQNGIISKAQIKKSSGHYDLDQAALSMLQQASPLPPIPASFNKITLDIVIPIEYSLITNQSYRSEI